MGRFSLDENASEQLAAHLPRQGHDAVAANEAGNTGASDVRQLLFATRAGRILVTHDLRHFGMLHEAWHTWAAEWGVVGSARHSGIIVLPTPPRLGIVEAAQGVDRLVRDVDSLENRLVAWEVGMGWSDIP